MKIQKQQSEAEKVSPCRVHGQVVAGLHWSVQASEPVVCSLHSGGLHCFYHACKGLLYLTLFFSFPSMTLNKDWSEQDFVLGVIVGKAQSIHMKHRTLLLDKSYLSLYLSYDWPNHAHVFFPWQTCSKVSNANLLSYVPAYLPEFAICVCNHDFTILIDNSQVTPMLYLFYKSWREMESLYSWKNDGLWTWWIVEIYLLWNGLHFKQSLQEGLWLRARMSTLARLRQENCIVR